MSEYKCSHTDFEKDTAVRVDGLCPLCLQEIVRIYRKALNRIIDAHRYLDAYDIAQDALLETGEMNI